MSDKFFDKDNNFIMWKDKGDLTEASKYVGENRRSIGIGESLATKIAKGKVDIDRTYGWVDKPLTVNWGKCGGTEDVIVTYNGGDSLWIPNAFLAQGTNGTSNQPKPDALYLADGVTKDTSVGYKTWFGRRDCDGVTERQPCDSNSNYLYISVYKLPQELGEWLYENAESNISEHRDYSSDVTTHAQYTSNYNYKGIAIYPESVSDWSNSSNWGVGIRKKEDIPYIGMYEGEPTYYHLYGETNSDDYSAIFNLDQWEALEDDAYYLVAQERGDLRGNDSWLSGQLSLFNIDDTGSDHIWLRRYNTMTQKPHWSEGESSWTQATDDPTNVGAKYVVPQEMCQQYDITNSTYTEKKNSLTVNWGKCGGTEDVVVTYNRDEGVWIPNAFLAQGTNGTSTSPKADQLYLSDGVTKDTSIGYKTYFTYDDYGDVTVRQNFQSTYRLYIAVYKLPQELGRCLYETAESNLIRRAGVSEPIVDYSVDSYSSNSSMDRNYKGIAIYPDTVSNWEKSGGWGVGIRMKKDIPYVGMNNNGEPTTNRYINNEEDGYSAIFNLSQWKALEDDAYYLVAQERGDLRDSTSFLTAQLALFDIDDTGTDHIYFRHYNTMTAPPSATNKGRKYTLADFDEQLTLPTPNEDQVVIDWGGGIKTYYKYGEPMYVPRAFLMEGFDNTGYPMPNRAVTGSGYVGFADSESATGSCLSVYKLPQELGEYLYNRAESTPTTGRYGSTSDPSYRIYRGIAVYSDTLVSGKNWNESDSWGIGIRKKNDLNIAGHNSDGTLYSYPLYTYTAVKEFMDDSSYYLVTQSSKNLSSTTPYFTYQWLQYFPKDEPVWMRSFKDMTAKPNGTTLMGEKMLYHPEYYAQPFGGKIFYIDPSDNGATYSFYDEDKNEITGGSTIADLANAKYYMVEGTPSKDKFYVFNDVQLKGAKPWQAWSDDRNITFGATGTAIGTGKSNTEIVLNSPLRVPTTMWADLVAFRASSDFKDWYIPSKDELFALGESGYIDAWFDNGSCYSSSEDISRYAWTYHPSYGMRSSEKNWNGSYAFIRSF